MKDYSKKSQTLQSIATHALAVAIFTQPWIVSFISDVLAIAGGNQAASLREQMMTAMSLVSAIALLVAAVFFTWYLMRDRK